MSREGNRPETLDERQRSNTSVSAGLLIPPDARQRDYKRVIRKKEAWKRYLQFIPRNSCHSLSAMHTDGRSIAESNPVDLPDFMQI